MKWPCIVLYLFCHHTWWVVIQLKHYHNFMEILKWRVSTYIHRHVSSWTIVMIHISNFHQEEQVAYRRMFFSHPYHEIIADLLHSYILYKKSMTASYISNHSTVIFVWLKPENSSWMVSPVFIASTRFMGDTCSTTDQYLDLVSWWKVHSHIKWCTDSVT